MHFIYFVFYNFRSDNGMNIHVILSTIIPLIGSSLPMGYGIGVMNCTQSVICIWNQEGMYKNYGIK